MNLKEAVTAAKQEVNDLFAPHEERSRWIAQVMAMLHFICGKAASGKTSLARELASRHSAVLFSEDEWLTLLDAEINSLADHQRHSKRLKAVLAPLAVRPLQLGVPIVFDFAGNTPNDRAWVRSIFERTDADPCAACNRRVR
jgi:predicted kinase